MDYHITYKIKKEKNLIKNILSEPMIECMALGDISSPLLCVTFPDQKKLVITLESIPYSQNKDCDNRPWLSAGLYDENNIQLTELPARYQIYDIWETQYDVNTYTVSITQ